MKKGPQYNLCLFSMCASDLISRALCWGKKPKAWEKGEKKKGRLEKKKIEKGKEKKGKYA